jgi:hypothetical protein
MLLRLGVVLVLAAASEASASTLTVPLEAATIQAAIDAEVDTVLVLPGVYPESLMARVAIVVAGRPDGTGERPVVDRVSIEPLPGLGGAGFRFEQLNVSGPVRIANNEEHCDIRFRDCEIGAGILDGSIYASTQSIALHRCFLKGTAFLLVDGGLCEVESCLVVGRIAFSGNTPTVRVVGCQMEGSGTEAGIATLTETVSCFVEGNSFSGYLVGVGLSGSELAVTRNQIGDCTSDGLRVSGGTVTITGNVVLRCRAGIIADGAIVLVSQNRVENSSATGVIASANEELTVQENVIWGAGGDGIAIGGASYRLAIVRGNTTCSGSGNGVVARGVNTAFGSANVENNIGFANHQYGLSWPAENAVTMACNDWFANQLGATENVATSSGDVAVDPRFCNADSGDFRLQATSPLADLSGCGLVGALGVGCELTGVVVRLFMAERVAEGVRIHWDVATRPVAAEIRVERAEDGPMLAWTHPATEQTQDGRGVVELDRGAAPDRVYWYRLVMLEGSQLAVLELPTRVGALAESRFGMLTAGPSPGRGTLRIGFTLGHDAPIEIEVFDVQGRVVASVAKGIWPAGRHEVEWSGQDRSGMPASAGWYLLRYRYPGGQDQQRILRSF